MPDATGPTTFAIGIAATLAVLPFFGVALVNLIMVRRGLSPLAQVVEDYMRRYPIFAAVIVGFIGALSGHVFWSFGDNPSAPPARLELLGSALVIAVAAGIVGALLLGAIGFGLDELVEYTRGDRGPRSWKRPTAATPALAAYAVVGVFAVTFGFVKLGWPHTSDAVATVAAVLVAGPLALGMLWPRLGGFKAFGFEVTLSQVTVQSSRSELVSVITSQQYYSGLEHVIRQVSNTIVRPDIEVTEVNLRDGNYWWPTRLFLLAALIEDYSSVRTMVFTEGDLSRRLVGMAEPGSVRSALATNFPTFEPMYQAVVLSGVVMSGVPSERISQIVNAWPGQYTSFGLPKSNAKPEDQLPRVSGNLLNDWLQRVGKPLLTDSISWSGITTQELYRSLVLDYRSQYVALLREGRLDRIVNRLQLAMQLVASGK